MEESIKNKRYKYTINGPALKNIIIKKGISPGDLACRLIPPYSVSFINKLLNSNTNRIPSEKVKQICIILGCKIDDVVFREKINKQLMIDKNEDKIIMNRSSIIEMILAIEDFMFLIPGNHGLKPTHPHMNDIQKWKYDITYGKCTIKQLITRNEIEDDKIIKIFNFILMDFSRYLARWYSNPTFNEPGRGNEFIRSEVLKAAMDYILDTIIAIESKEVYTLKLTSEYKKNHIRNAIIDKEGNVSSFLGEPGMLNNDNIKKRLE